MTTALVIAGLAAGIPVLLALGDREQGREVLRQMMRILRVLPELLRDGAERVFRRGQTCYRETLRRGGIRDSWVQQTVGALVFAPAALIGIGALVINVVATLAGAQDTTIPLIEALSAAGLGPVLLMGLEMGLSCLLFPALVVELMGITNISYYYSAENIQNKWLRRGLLAFFVAGAIAAGYLVWQGGLLRGAIVEGTSGGQNLVQASGLESGTQPAGGAAPSTSPAPTSPAPKPKGPSQAAVLSLTAGPSVLGYLAGAVALVFVIPAAALLVATPLFLAITIPVGIVYLPTWLITWFVDTVYLFMLSIFNYVLRLRGAEPVEGPGNRNVPGEPGAREDSSSDTERRGPASSSHGSSDRSPAPGDGSPAPGTGPASRDSDGREDRTAENGRSDDPAEDAAQTGPLYDEDDENWNPIT